MWFLSTPLQEPQVNGSRTPMEKLVILILDLVGFPLNTDLVCSVIDSIGFRLPFYVISPWTRGGHVFTERADHNSQIMFVGTTPIWLVD